MMNIVAFKDLELNDRVWFKVDGFQQRLQGHGIITSMNKKTGGVMVQMDSGRRISMHRTDLIQKALNL